MPPFFMFNTLLGASEKRKRSGQCKAKIGEQAESTD